MSLSEIRSKFGPSGIQHYAEAYGRLGAITDDTQMTLFTAEGLLRAHSRWQNKGICHVPSVVHHSYIRWLHTQGEKSAHRSQGEVDNGWLITLAELHHRRAPGNTCLAALYGTEMGTIDHPLNDSKGCGGVMRVAPVGLVTFAQQTFDIGCELAAITHGHASGYLAAGMLAVIIQQIVAGESLEDAMETSLLMVQKKPQHEQCLSATKHALALWRDTDIPVSADTVERLGAGWVAEEALAISLYCALCAGEDFRKGVLLAVNHSGDSDSTGAITGNILGAFLGKQAIPAEWLEQLELRDEIEEVSRDLLLSYEDTDAWWQKYPGW